MKVVLVLVLVLILDQGRTASSVGHQGRTGRGFGGLVGSGDLALRLGGEPLDGLLLERRLHPGVLDPVGANRVEQGEAFEQLLCGPGLPPGDPVGGGGDGVVLSEADRAVLGEPFEGRTGRCSCGS